MTYIHTLMNKTIECLMQHLNITKEQACNMLNFGQITIQAQECVPSVIQIIEGNTLYVLVENKDDTVSVKYSQPIDE